MESQIKGYKKRQFRGGTANNTTERPRLNHRMEVAIKIASYLWVPTGLLISLFFGRTIARAYTMMPGVFSEAFLIQTVCPLIKLQFRVFFGWVGIFGTLLAQVVLARTTQVSLRGTELAYGR